MKNSILRKIIKFECQNKNIPFFQIPESSIKIIKTPTEFYNKINNGIKQSKNRISLTSLYLGTGELEKTLIKNLNKNLQKNTELRFKLVLDGFRGQRENKEKNSSLKILENFLTVKKSDKVRITFFRNNSFMNNFQKLRENYFFQNSGLCEIFGTFHSKIIIFDNSVILTGANLSEDYFVNRKDRYIIINDCEKFANFLEDYIEIFNDLGDCLGFRNNLDGFEDDFEKLDVKKLKEDFEKRIKLNYFNYSKGIDYDKFEQFLKDYENEENSEILDNLKSVYNFDNKEKEEIKISISENEEEFKISENKDDFKKNKNLEVLKKKREM